MSEKILIFAGTTEGRMLAEYLAAHKVPAQVCVATEYGSQLVEKNEFITVSAGRLDCQGMQDLIRCGFTLVIDATHPYAAVVSANLREACRNTGTEYMRLLRRQGSYPDDIITVPDVEAAVKYLQNTSGNILVATGSKELAKFTALKDYQDRVYARVLSTADVARACADLGFEGRNLICMQGPFCEELNYGMMKQVSAEYIVTKDSGKVGGFDDKIRAAKRAGVKTVLVGRPSGDEGLSYEEVIAALNRRLSISAEETVRSAQQKKITFVSIGMGGAGQLTLDAVKALEDAEIVIGAERMLKSVKEYCGNTHQAYLADEVMDFIQSHDYCRIAVAVSGDAGFYSAAKKLINLAEKAGCETEIICGISSVVYFCSKLKMSWDDVFLMSAHGREANAAAAVRSHKKTFLLLNGSEGVHRLCRELLEFGMDSTTVYLGENFSYRDEKIVSGRPSELADGIYGSLCAALIVNEAYSQESVLSIDDEDFIRGAAPMTKSEIRTLAVSKLRLPSDAVIYDVGAGTGSVSIELALSAPQGKVYAVEREEEAVELIKQNRTRFAASNLEIICGTAPEALQNLPAPTHVFIGGSSGNLKEIIDVILAKNENTKFVVTAVTLETIAEAAECMSGFLKQEAVHLSVAKAKELGSYHLMTAQNPVYIFTFNTLKR